MADLMKKLQELLPKFVNAETSQALIQQLLQAESQGFFNALKAEIGANNNLLQQPPRLLFSSLAASQRKQLMEGNERFAQYDNASNPVEIQQALNLEQNNTFGYGGMTVILHQLGELDDRGMGLTQPLPDPDQQPQNQAQPNQQEKDRLENKLQNNLAMTFVFGKQKLTLRLAPKPEPEAPKPRPAQRLAQRPRGPTPPP